MALRIEWQAHSDAGTVRAVNEDRFVALPNAGVWAVADGMGGHESGDWASACIARALEDACDGGDLDSAATACADAIHAANAEIYREATARAAQMGSTVVALVLRGRRFAVFWAGDSRAYLLREGALIPLTRDHSQVQALVERGILSPEEAIRHPMGHVLARAVGVEPELVLDGIMDAVRPGDVFLLCSDGVHGVVPDPDIAALLERIDVHEAAVAIVELSLARGSADNVTAIAVRAQEPTLVLPGAALEAEL